jgi:hypothetical protein
MAQVFKANVYELNIEARSGDDLYVPIGWKDSSGAYLDFTGCIGLCQFKKNKASEAIDGVLEVDLTTIGAYPNIVLKAPGSVITAAGVGLFYFDVQITHPNGTVRTYIEGKLKITQDVSR